MSIHRHRVWIVATLVVLLGLLLPSLAAGRAVGTPTRVVVEMEVQYGAGDQLVLDVFRPADAAAAPVVILIHGGGWSEGDKDRFEGESRSLASAGFVVFDINYTLAAEAGPAYPSQIDDVHTALTWVENHAAGYGGDPGRIGVLGGSAGGYLAAMLAYQANTASNQPVRLMVSLSGPMDIPGIATALRGAVRNPDGTCAPEPCDVLDGVTASMQTLLGCDPVDCSEDLLRAASPTSYVTEHSPPSYFANGSDESVSPDQSTAIAALLRASGVPVQTRVVPGDLHSVELVPAVAEDLLDFLTSNLAAEAATPVPSTSAPGNQTVEQPAAMERRRSPVRWLVAAAAVTVLGLAVVVGRARRAP